MAKDENRVGRRGFVVTAGAVTAAATVGGTALADAPERPRPGMLVHRGGPRPVPGERAEGSPPDLGSVRPGARFRDAEVEAVRPIRMGAVAILLRSADGTRFQLDLLRRDPGGVEGVATTPTLSLFVANRGDGATPTDEEQGLTAMAIADTLRREGTGVGGLLTWRERRTRNPHGPFTASR